MSTTLGVFRKRLFAPDLSEVTFRRRGFPTAPLDSVRHLESIPQAVVCGFEWAMETRNLSELQRRLSLITAQHRGFAYEGAAMACTILDVLPGRRADRTRALLDGPGQPHIFLSYIGIGFAMARLPRPLWAKVLPTLAQTRYHPTMSWLAVDGYGFDLAYFHTRRVVSRQEIPRPYPWHGRPEYFPRAVDQGIGRALWFIHGAQVVEVAAAVERFSRSRRADLWSGVGLAATFAGGCAAEDLGKLRSLSENYVAELAVGSVFATKARSYADYVPTHTEEAARVITERSVSELVELADRTAVDRDGSEPAYELWRQRIRAHFN